MLPSRSERPVCNRLNVMRKAKLLRDSIEVIDVEALAAPSVRQRFEGHIKADCVPEPKAVSYRAGDAVDGHGVPL